MAIPDFQSTMRPLLEYLADGKIPSSGETIEALSKHFQLTNAELAELVPRGQQSIFINRIAWAKSYLKKSELLESPARGLYKITARGLEAVESNFSKK
jgi:restriction system protein